VNDTFARLAADNQLEDQFSLSPQVSATLENEADPTLENEATGSSSSSLPRLGF
jgi:hypothetical protein